MASNSPEFVVLTKPGINGKTVANTTIATTENGTQRFMVMMFFVESTAATSISAGATWTLGTNSATYDNLVTGIGGPTTLNGCAYGFVNGSVGPSVAANTDIVFKISTGATGTSQTLRVDVVGYYI